MTPAPANLELELKLWLSADEHQRLEAELPHRIGDVVQHNLFLDTPDGQLSAGRWALRVRREERADTKPRVVVALKGPATRVAGAVHRTEIEAVAPSDLWSRALAGSLSPDAIDRAPGQVLREKLAVRAPLNPVLQFTNHRTTFRLPLDGEEHRLELDRTEFATGQVDHELELELPASAAPDDAQALLAIHSVSVALKALLAGYGVQVKPSAGGKFSRGLRYADRS